MNHLIDSEGRTSLVIWQCMAGPYCGLSHRASRRIVEADYAGHLGMSVACALAAVDVKDLAGHEARRLEVEDRVDDVRDLAHAADRMESGEPGIGLDGMHRRLDDAQRDGVHPAAPRGILD